MHKVGPSGHESMSVGELPKRTALIGPHAPVRCDVPEDVIDRYRDALTRWDPTDPVPCDIPADEMARVGEVFAERLTASEGRS